MADLDALIAKLEAAQEGSRELDSEIERRVVVNHSWPARHWTTSLDAALALGGDTIHWREIIVKALDMMATLPATESWTIEAFRCRCCAIALKARKETD